eukprot:CAMPEP_0113690832 /NCGR_PEP_ID=MMETSP0038_2-20120614/18037_1 /TAXON_ID=2898 /ORGANISM="Cryptomonas paramecium" /LENGTH=169 /DNA_ID=CAMNT_0000612255 /DNA_START=18 /DNA_END=524 /DNA_ORIENTATION=+ /assembly_acc=CAM_ASM_000170
MGCGISRSKASNDGAVATPNTICHEDSRAGDTKPTPKDNFLEFSAELNGSHIVSKDAVASESANQAPSSQAVTPKGLAPDSEKSSGGQLLESPITGQEKITPRNSGHPKQPYRTAIAPRVFFTDGSFYEPLALERRASLLFHNDSDKYRATPPSSADHGFRRSPSAPVA